MSRNTNNYRYDSTAGDSLNDKIHVSIVITAFNQHHEVVNTIAGIAVQSEQNPSVKVEIIIVDNGSSPRLNTILDGKHFDFQISFIRRSSAKRNFRPGSARNMGIGASKGDFILFLDGDCIPGPFFLRDHYEFLKAFAQPVVTLGHRIFIDGRDVTPVAIRKYQCNFYHIPEVASSSNYWLSKDRRLKEFKDFDCHPMPFHCCHGCNVGIRRVDLKNVGGFDEDFDGYWGYEDIEFGYRMWAQGAKLLYLCTAYVYHQEGNLVSFADRTCEARRNYALVCRKIPGFKTFRDSLKRPYYSDC